MLVGLVTSHSLTQLSLDPENNRLPSTQKEIYVNIINVNIINIINISINIIYVKKRIQYWKNGILTFADIEIKCHFVSYVCIHSCGIYTTFYL